MTLPPVIVRVSESCLARIGEDGIAGARLVGEGGSTTATVVWRRQGDRTRWLLNVLATSPSIGWVHTDTAGVDRLPLTGLEHRGALVSNAGGVYTAPVGEWAVGALLLCAKRFDETVRHSDARTWSEPDGIRTVAGATVVVIGMGRIGSMVARTVRALGARVIGVTKGDPGPDDPRHQHANTLVAVGGPWHRQLASTSFVVVAAPLTPETHGLVDADVLRALPAGAWVINAGRGPLIDESALLAALDEGRLGGAVLDTFETEPLPGEHQFWGRPNLVVSPHVASRDPGADLRCRQHFEREVARVAGGGSPASLVDLRAGY